MIPKAKFTIAEAEQANDEWGFNCGPAALAAILDLDPEGVRSIIPDFEKKRYTNPSMMLDALKNKGVRFQETRRVGVQWPRFGLARVQWEGPWMNEGVPIAARYRHTHWVGSGLDSRGIQFVFDINAMSAGGWIDDVCWGTQLVPWLLRTCHQRSNGRWHLTHAIEVFV